MSSDESLLGKDKMRLSIRVKIILITVIIISLAFGANTLISSYVFTREYSAALQAQALIVAKTLDIQLNRLLSLGIALDDIVGFEEQCQDVVNQYEEISYALIVDTNGQILFHNDPLQHNKVLTSPALLAGIKKKEATTQRYTDESGTYYDVTVPIFGIHNEHIAAVRVGIPIEIVNQKTNQLRAYSAISTLASLGFAIILLVSTLSRWITDPLTKLVSAIQDVRLHRPELGQQVEINSGDEIGALASAFNQMSHDLKESHEAIRKHTRELESRVQDRTLELTDTNKKLQVEISERKQAQRQIEASLVEKEVLLQEIHHRVKNNLQIIASLLSLQSEQIRDPQALKIFEESQIRVRSMAIIHEKLYQSDNMAQINFAEYIHDLLAYLFRSYDAGLRKIGLNTQLQDVFFKIDKAIPCSLIINELVANSMEHAFPNGRTGEIEIGLKEENHRVILTVKDNGVGLSNGMDPQTHTSSLGLQLINMLTDQLNGEIVFDNSGVGFAVTISFLFS